MYDLQERIRLEETIIGACLQEGAFEQVNDILLHTDFRAPRYLIYTAFIRLHESGDVITPRTVYRLLEKVGKNVEPIYLTHCVMSVSQWYSPHSHCLLLIEYKLEDDISSICSKHLHGRVPTLDGQLASSCLKKLIEYKDPIKTIDLISAYLQKRSPESPLTKEITSLYQNFTNRCNKIKVNLAK